MVKKNNDVGMPVAIMDVVEAVAELRQKTTAEIEELVCANFARLVDHDPGLRDLKRIFSGNE